MVLNSNYFQVELEKVFQTNTHAVLSADYVYEYKDKKRTDNIIGTRYTLVNVSTFETFDVKCANIKLVVSQEDIDKSSKRFLVTIDKGYIKPLSIEYGKAKCSVIADSVSLIK